MSIEDRIFQEQAGNTFYKVRANRALSMGVWSESDLPGVDDGAEYRGSLVQIPGSTGVADKLLVMRKNAGNTYEWARLFVAESDAFGVTSVFNVKDYGATGDGTTNDTTALVATLAAAVAAGGGTVYFPPGTYMAQQTNLLFVTSAQRDIHFMGAGRTLTTIKAIASASGTRIFNIQGTNCSIRHLTVDGNFPNVPGAFHAVNIAGVGHTIEDVDILYSAGYGIGAGQAGGLTLQNFTVRDVRIIQPGSDGIDIKNQLNTNINIVLDNVYVEDWDVGENGGDAGIDLRGPVRVVNCQAVETGDVTIGAGDGIRFRQSNVDPTDPTIVNGAYRGVATNCQVFGAGTVSTGITVLNYNASISNCVVHDCVNGFGNIANAYGVRASMTNCKAFDCSSRGFHLGNQAMATNIEARDCAVGIEIEDADVQVSTFSTVDCTTGVRLDGDRASLRGGKIIGSSGTGLLGAATADATTIEGVDFSQHSGTKVNSNATNTRWGTNPGYVTRNAGVTSAADGGTIAHGLVTTPTKYGATTTTADEYLAITAVSSTTLTVALTKHDGTAGTTANVAWWAEV